MVRARLDVGVELSAFFLTNNGFRIEYQSMPSLPLGSNLYCVECFPRCSDKCSNNLHAGELQSKVPVTLQLNLLVLKNSLAHSQGFLAEDLCFVGGFQVAKKLPALQDPLLEEELQRRLHTATNLQGDLYLGRAVQAEPVQEVVDDRGEHLLYRVLVEFSPQCGLWQLRRSPTEENSVIFVFRVTVLAKGSPKKELFPVAFFDSPTFRFTSMMSRNGRVKGKKKRILPETYPMDNNVIQNIPHANYRQNGYLNHRPCFSADLPHLIIPDAFVPALTSGQSHSDTLLNEVAVDVPRRAPLSVEAVVDRALERYSNLFLNGSESESSQQRMASLRHVLRGDDFYAPVNLAPSQIKKPRKQTKPKLLQEFLHGRIRAPKAGIETTLCYLYGLDHATGRNVNDHTQNHEDTPRSTLDGEENTIRLSDSVPQVYDVPTAEVSTQIHTDEENIRSTAVERSPGS